MKKDYKLAETQQKFQSFYKANLQQIYKQLEETRQKYFYSFVKRFICSLLFIGGTYYLCLSNIISEGVYTSELFINVAIIVLLIICGVIYQPFCEYRKQTKDLTMQKILSFWGKFDYFFEQDIIGNETVKKSELFTYYNNINADDAFSGKYDKTELKVSEHNLRIHGSKGDTHIFKGVFVLLNFPKKFAGQTVVKSKNRNYLIFIYNPLLLLVIPMVIIPWIILAYSMSKDGLIAFAAAFPLLIFYAAIYLIYRLYKKFHPDKATQNVALEKIDFAKKWNVLTDNQVEARYILSPVFMEQIEEIKKMFHGKSIDFSFFDNKLFIAVHTTKNLFETTSLFSKALNYHKVREVVTQLHSIFSIIDILEKH